MSKLKEDFRIAVLGAAGGLFAIGVSLMMARIHAYYSYLSWLQETDSTGTYYATEDLWWVPVAIWHLILSVTAALLAHRHLTTRLRSTFLLWQMIGFGSLLGWGLTLFLVIGIECLMNGNLLSLERLLRPSDLAIVAQYASAAFACNVFYGSVMKASSGQYTAQFDELAGESSNVDHLLTTS